jgi:hypothetical protein
MMAWPRRALTNVRAKSWAASTVAVQRRDSS